MIGIAIANSIGSRRSSAPVVVVPIATAATGVGSTSFTANWNAFAGANYYLLDVSLNSSFSSFVGSYQNYVVIGTSQVVSGLTPLTTYYYRLRAVTGVDADAASFFSRVYTAGGSLSYTEVTATEKLVADMKSAGIWTSMKAVYPMVGASAAACAQNLKSSSFTGSFSSGWTFASTGVTGNGTSAYMDSGFNPNTEGLTYDNNHISFYSRTSAAAGAIQYYDIGCGNGPADTNLSLWSRRFEDTAGYDCAGFPLNRSTFANTNGQGFYCGTAVTTTSKFYKNGTSQVSKSLTSKSFQSANIYVGSFNEANTKIYYSAKEIAFSSIGNGLTDTQASNFYTAVQTFNQTLSRSVGPQIVSDADAQAYINRVYTAGGTLTNTEANAVNQLVIDMKAAGIWTAMKAVYPMVGASAAACAQNLKSSSFTGSFTSGWTFSSTGVTPNGTSAYMDTAFSCFTNLSTSSQHVSFYSRTNILGEYDLGSYIGTAEVALIARFTNGQAYTALNTPSFATTTNTDGSGFFIGSRITNNLQKLFRNTTIIATNSTTVTANNNVNITLSASNRFPSPVGFGNKQCAFASIGDGLTDTQAADFYTCVQTFNTTLSRQV